MSSVCRVCLDSNKQLLSVKNNMLHNIYEKITNTKFNSDDARPRTLCRLCYQKLLRCHTFSQIAVRSEKIFSHIYDKGLEITHEYITEVNLNVKQHLSVANTTFITIDDSATNAGSQVTIKDEPLPSIDMNEEFTTAQDTLLETESFPEVCTQSQITFEEDISDQENDTDELLSENINNDQSKPDASSFTIKDEPLSCIDIKEEITTELDKLVESKEVDTKIHAAKPNDSNLPFICNNCNKIFNIKSKLISHIINFHSQYKGKQFSSAKKHTGPTDKHMITHTGEKPFACNVCNKQYIRKDNLVSHIRTHTGEKPLACHVCEKRFNFKSILNKHMITHTCEKPFACNVCDKQFNQKGNLLNHMKIHTGKKPFSCSVCDKQFTRKCNLVSHMTTHTDEKPFACNVCNKQFNRKSHIVDHMRTHTGEKPFACNVCDKLYNRKDNLVTHIRTHTGEKPFACNVCEKRYNQKSTLVNHMKTHAGEKPFSCHVCEKRFYVKSNLNKHMTTHTGKIKQFKRKVS